MQNDFFAVIRAALVVLVIAALLPIIGILHAFGSPWKFKVHALMCWLLIHIINIKIKVKGHPAQETPALYISNHSSYLDILVLWHLIKKPFVAKQEVNDWPVFGWSARFVDCIFIDRSVSKTEANIEKIKHHFVQGGGLTLFAEGTTSNGNRVLPFKSSMFTLLEHDLGGKKLSLQPVSIVYTRINNIPIGIHMRPYFAWYGEMSLVPHLWQLLKFYSVTAEVEFFPAIAASAFKSRKDAADYCHEKISGSVAHALTGRKIEAKPEKMPY